MKDIDLTTLEGAKRFIESVVDSGLHENFAKDGHIVPVAFLFAAQDPNGVPFDKVEPIPVAGIGVMQNEGTKDGYAATLQKLVDKTKACGIVTVSESWTHDSPALYAGLRSCGIPPEQIPGVKEVVHVVLEHTKAKSPVMYQAVIARNAEGKGTLGPLSIFQAERLDTGEKVAFDGTHDQVRDEGRFGGMLRGLS